MIYSVMNLLDSGPNSLRNCIESANADPGSTVNFDPSLNGDILLASVLPTVAAAMTINGLGAKVGIDGGGAYQIMVISASSTVKNLAFKNGWLNPAAGTTGGAINKTSGTLSVENCTFTGNNANFGCVHYNAGGTSTFTNCTVTGTSNSNGGKVFWSDGDTYFVNCTVAGNTANGDSYNGCIFGAGSGSNTLLNCIVWGNTASDAIYHGTATVTYTDSQDGKGGTGNINSDPSLSGLASNGGATQTMAITPSSSAYQAGTASGAPTFDQIGTARLSPPSMGAYDHSAGPSAPGVQSAPVKVSESSSQVIVTNIALTTDTDYQILERTDDNGATSSECDGSHLDGTEGNQTASMLSNATGYKFRYHSYGAGGDTPGTWSALITTLTGTPTGLTATPGDGQAVLNWDAVTGATGFKAELSTDGGTTFDVAYDGTGLTATTATITGLTNGVPCIFRVTALDAGGESEDSSVATCTPQPPVPDAATLTGVSLTDDGSIIQAVLTWTNPGTGAGATSINAKRGTISGGETNYGSALSPTATTTTVPVTYNADWYFKVSRVNGGGAASSNELHIKSPTAPVSALIAIGGNMKVTLRWTNPAGCLGIIVQRSPHNADDWTQVASLGIVTSWTDTDVVNGTTYDYRVLSSN